MKLTKHHIAHLVHNSTSVSKFTLRDVVGKTPPKYRRGPNFVYKEL